MKYHCLRKHIKRQIKELKLSSWSPELEGEKEKEKWIQRRIGSDFANASTNTKPNFKGRGTKYRPFNDYVGKTVFHCHLMFHGDNGMMGTFEIVK